MFELYSADAMKAVTSEAPTSTKWVDMRKMNDDGEEFMRSSWWPETFVPDGGGPDRPDLFAAMPPQEAKKMLFIMTVTGVPSRSAEQRTSRS